jgi:hypothetical protein
MLAQATRLGQALLVVPLLVLLTPLRFVGLRLRELLLRSCSCLCVFARGMLAGDRSATRGHETDHGQGYDDQGKDDPRDHADSVLRGARVNLTRGLMGETGFPP